MIGEVSTDDFVDHEGCPLYQRRHVAGGPAEGPTGGAARTQGARCLFLASLAVMTRIEDHYRRGDKPQDEAAGRPLQPHSDRVAEEDDDDGHRYQGDDRGMGAESFHHRNLMGE